VNALALVGKIDLRADRDVTAGAEVSLSELFPYPERSKEFTLESDITRDTTKLKLKVAKLGTVDTTADTTKKKGEKTNIWMLTKISDFSRKVKAAEAIKKGDTLSITVETA
jgi:hypothetical protein